MSQMKAKATRPLLISRTIFPAVHFTVGDGRCALEVRRLATPVAILPGLLKSQSENQDKEPEIMHKSTQSKVFRTLQILLLLKSTCGEKLNSIDTINETDKRSRNGAIFNGELLFNLLYEAINFKQRIFSKIAPLPHIYLR
ncbi:hypothetical protein ACWM9A_14710 [Acetobacter pasteurianus]